MGALRKLPIILSSSAKIIRIHKQTCKFLTCWHSFTFDSRLPLARGCPMQPASTQNLRMKSCGTSSYNPKLCFSDLYVCWFVISTHSRSFLQICVVPVKYLLKIQTYYIYWLHSLKNIGLGTCSIEMQVYFNFPSHNFSQNFRITLGLKLICKY